MNICACPVPLQPLPLIQRNPAGQARYYFNEEKPHIKYSSVTSILSATQSESTRYALKRWKAKILAEGGDPEETRNEAARRGSRIHDWFEQFLLGQNPKIPDDIAPWCNHLVSSPLWERLDHVVCTEHQVCSDEHLVPFAGTLDALIKINGQLQAYRLGLKENYGIQVDRFLALYAFPDQPAYPVGAAGDELKQHEIHWTKRMQAYDMVQKAACMI
jgi:hypothetical protein